MKRTKYGTYTLVFVVALLISLLMPTSTASAASVYDSIVQTTASVELRTNTVSCSTSSAVDYSDDWMEEVGDILNARASSSPSLYSPYLNAWNAKTDWAVIVTEGANNQKYFTVYYSTDNEGGNSFFSSGGDDYFMISTISTGGTIRQLEVTTAGDAQSSCDSDMYIIGVTTGGAAFTASEFNTRKLYASTYYTHYPSGYDGAVIPSGPVTTPYSGTVDCGGEDPESVIIYQPGNSGGATLTPVSLGRANWSYHFTAAAYTFTVYCGGELATSYGTVYPSTGTDWICDVYGEGPHYCVLS